MGNMNGWKHTAVVVLSAALITVAAAREKKVYGLVFEAVRPLKAPPVSCYFLILQGADPFFKNLKQVKSKGSVEYRRGHDVVTDFPDSITARVFFRPSDLSNCGALPAFDPARIKFRVEWQNGTQIVPAKGTEIKHELRPGVWCENNCVGTWIYELRIDSQNVPLNDNLVIKIEAEDSTQLVEYIGKFNIEAQQVPPPSLPPVTLIEHQLAE
jgi:hypothetical protein